MQLKREIGLPAAITLIVGQVIGIGIFLTPAGMARSVGSPFWLLVIWFAVALMTLCGSLCYSELAARYPEAGGSYVYLREAFGRKTAFLYGWTVLLVLDPGLTAIFAVGMAAYASVLLPLDESGKQLLAIASILVVGGINILGLRLGTSILAVLTVLKISTLVFIIVYGFGGSYGEISHFEPFFATPGDVFGALAGGLVGAFFAFAGWWEVTRVAGEIRDPERNVPRALIVGVAILTLLYILTSAVFMYLVPAASVTSDETFAAQAGRVMFGEFGEKIFSAAVIISVLGTLFAYFIASPRVYFAMASDGTFFSAFGRVHKRFGTPYLATIVQMVIACVLVVSGSFNEIVSYFFFVVVLFVAITVAGLFRIGKTPFAGYKTPLFPFTPMFFILATCVVLFFIAMRDPLQTAIGIGIVLLGLPVYHLSFSTSDRK